jgi:hypothetical protein
MPANNSQFRRDIQFGVYIIDTFSTQPTSTLESGQMTVDPVEIEKYDLVTDRTMTRTWSLKTNEKSK